MILLDTHALVWWADDPDKLSKKSTELIKEESVRGTVVVSAISLWEIALLIKSKRLVLSVDLTTWVDRIERSWSVKIIPIDANIAIKSVNLPEGLHQDPADRMIIATARELEAKLVTKDRKILGYSHVRAVW